MARNDVETVTTDARAALGGQYDTALARYQVAEQDRMRQEYEAELAAYDQMVREKFGGSYAAAYDQTQGVVGPYTQFNNQHAYAQMVQERFGGNYALADDARGIQPLTYSAMGTAMDLAAVKGLVTLGAGLVGRAVSRLPAPRMVALPGGKVVPASKAGYVQMPSIDQTPLGIAAKKTFAPPDAGTRADVAWRAHNAWVSAQEVARPLQRAANGAGSIEASMTTPEGVELAGPVMPHAEAVRRINAAIEPSAAAYAAHREAKAALIRTRSPFKLNQESHIWRFGEAKAHGSPYVMPDTVKRGMWRHMGHLLNPTGTGAGPRMLSRATRAALREVSPVVADTRSAVGSFLHWLSSPSAFGVLDTALYAGALGLKAAQKLGWAEPMAEKLARENRELAENAKRNARSAGSGRPAITPPPSHRQNPVDAAVDLDVIRQQHVDFQTVATTNRPAAVAQFNAWYANASPEVQARIATDVEKRALAVHYPQFMSSYGDLNRTDKGRAFLEDFRKRVIRSRSMGEWFGTDWSAYGRWLRQQRVQREGGR